MIILLIASIKAVTYWTPGYCEKEYARHNVTADINMETGDLLDMMKEMMVFLRDDRVDLHMEITAGGVRRGLFNEREIARMVDMQGLFLATLMIRRICLAAAAVCVITLFLLKSNVKKILPKSIYIGTDLFFALICMLAGIIFADFSKCSMMLRHIFSSNDLWILDPAVDLFINIVPEPFFMDAAARIALTYGMSALTLFLTYFFYLRKQKR